MKILKITTIASTLRAFLLPFAHHFQAYGWNVDAMANGVSKCNKCRGTFRKVFEIDWSRNLLDPNNFLRSVSRVREVVSDNGYDIVHVHTPIASFLTRYALRSLRTRGLPKVVYTAHGFHFYRGGAVGKNMLFLSLEKLAGKWTDHLIVINQEDKQSARNYGIAPPERISYIPGVGVDTEFYQPDGDISAFDAIRRELVLDPNDLLFLMIAEFTPKKRHKDAINAFCLLNDTRAHLAFAGAGPLLEKMKLLARKLKLENKLHFLEERSDIPALIGASVATILTSEREGLPRSVLESMAMGVPVIGTRIRGVEDLLNEGAGILVPAGDVSGIADAMKSMIDKREIAMEMGRIGRKHIMAYDIRNILKLYEGVYEKVLSSHLDK